MATPILTYEDHILNSEIKKGDVFRRVFEVVSEPKITDLGYEWKVYHKRYRVYMRMLRPDPRFFLSVDEQTTDGFIRSCEEKYMLMQLHPRIEAFYNLLRIGESAALITEWLERGTLRDCIEDGSLYQGSESEVDDRLFRIAGQIARAAQYLEKKGITDSAAIAENVMITERWNAKLSVANMSVDRCEEHHDSNMRLWAYTVLQMYLGRFIPYDIDGINENFSGYMKCLKIGIPMFMDEVIASVFRGELTDWERVFGCLRLPEKREYDCYWPGLISNYIMRLLDRGEWENTALELKERLTGNFDDWPIRYNLFLLARYADPDKMNQNYGGVDWNCSIGCWTDILLYAELNARKNVWGLLDKYGTVIPYCVAQWLPEIHEKLLDRPRMTRLDIKGGDPRLILVSDDRIVVDIFAGAVEFKPLPEDSGQFPIPGKDGLVWDKDRLILPDSGIIEGLDYTVRKFHGHRYLFDAGLKFLMSVCGDDIQIFPLDQYDNRFRAPFLLYTDVSCESEI